VPVLGVWDGADGEAVPPVDGVPVAGVPALGVAPAVGVVVVVVLPFFFLSPGVTAWPVGRGGAGGWIVCVLDLEPPPPLEAIAITTIRKNAAAAAATNLRRR
jgi:hypothetical protein